MNTTTSDTVITLTASAVAELKRLLGDNPEYAGKHLRVYVEQGGCSGKQYGMLFDEKRENDLIAEASGVSVLVDPVSADHLRGSTLDFSHELMGGGFKFTNPNARQSCGCGKSFEA